MSDAVILGGGVLGGAIARVAADGGAQVTVLSRNERPHRGLWRRFEAKGAALLVRDAAVFVALAPGPRDDPAAFWTGLVPDLVRAAWLGGARTVTACVPAAGAAVEPPALQRVGRTTVLRYGPLVSAEAGCVAPWVRAVREGGVARIPRGLPDVWPLVVDDAARAAWGLAPSGDIRTLRGRERLTTRELATLLVERFGGRWTERWIGGIDAAHRRMLAAAVHLDDDWDDVRMGPRSSVATWIERLAGPRRRR